MIVLKLQRRVLRSQWRYGYENTSVNKIKLLIEQHFEAIKAVLDKDRELQSIFKSAKLKLPHDRRDLREWVDQDLTEDKARVLLQNIQNSRGFNLNYIRNV